MIYAKVIEDSINAQGNRLTTIEACLHRYVWAECLTHRRFSRNSASSRAIPVHKMLEQVATDIAMPVEFGSAKKGMQAGPPLEGETLKIAQQIWRDAASKAYQSASELVSLGVHKQVVNRILEPFLWHKVIISATEWDNFFLQRCSPLAQPEMNELACAIREAINNSNPVNRTGGWHTPYLLSEERELPLPLRLKISTARCARVSYLTHDGRRDNSEDVKMFDNKLIAADPPHWSPMEHVACPYDGVGEKNFKGWTQLRWFLEQGYPVLNTGEQNG